MFDIPPEPRNGGGFEPEVTTVYFSNRRQPPINFLRVRVSNESKDPDTEIELIRQIKSIGAAIKETLKEYDLVDTPTTEPLYCISHTPGALAIKLNGVPRTDRLVFEITEKIMQQVPEATHGSLTHSVGLPEFSAEDYE